MAKEFSGGYSALGNYVHFNPNNYKKYGIYWQGYRREAKELEDGTIEYHDMTPNKGMIHQYKYNHAQASAWIDNQLKNLRTNLKTLNELKKRLRLLSIPNEKNDESTLGKKEQLMIKAVFEVLARTTNLDRVGSIQGTKGRSRNYNISKEEYQNSLFNANRKTLENQKGKTISEKSIEYMYKQGYEKIKKAYNKMINDSSEKNIDFFIQSMNDFLVKLDVSKLTSEFGAINKNDIKSLKGFMELYDLANRYNSSKYTVLGRFGEVLTSFLDDAVYDIAVENADETVKDFVDHAFTYGGWTGDKQSSFKMEPHQIVGSNKNLTVKMKDEYDSLFEVHHSQDKIDTSITIKGDKIGTTVKTYSDFSKGIDLQKGSEGEGKQRGIGLLDTLVVLNTQIAGFGTHWMNRHVQGSKLSSDKLDKIVKKYIVYQAFASGNALKGSTPAKVLIMFDVKNGSANVLDIGRFLMSNFEKNGVNFTPKDLKGIFISNEDFAKKGKRATRQQIERRLVKNVLDLRKTKINVSYTPKGNFL